MWVVKESRHGRGPELYVCLMHTPCFLDSPICPVAVFALSLALFILCRLRGRTLAAVSQSIEAASASASAATSIQLSAHLSRVASFLCTGAATEL